MNLSIRYGLGPEINDGLVGGSLDFAIVDDYSFDSEIELDNLTQEELVLCAHQEYEATISQQKRKTESFSKPFLTLLTLEIAPFFLNGSNIIIDSDS